MSSLKHLEKYMHFPVGGSLLPRSYDHQVKALIQFHRNSIRPADVEDGTGEKYDFQKGQEHVLNFNWPSQSAEKKQKSKNSKKPWKQWKHPIRSWERRRKAGSDQMMNMFTGVEVVIVGRKDEENVRTKEIRT